MTAFERYRRVLAAPHVGMLFASSVAARLPMGVNGLAIVLFVREQTGSFAAAGAAVGANALAAGLGSPLQGRWTDRHGPRLVLPRLVALQTVGVLAFVALGAAGAPAGVLVALAFVAGLGMAPWSSVMRAMWPRLLPDPALMTTAFALDSTVIELVFVIGPLLAALLTALLSPAVALLASAVLGVAGAAAFVRSPAVLAWEPERHPDRSLFGALRSRGLRTVVLTTIPLGFAFGAVEGVTLPAFAAEHGHASAAGLLIAAWALGSGAGGLLFGARDWTSPLSTLFAAGVTMLAVSLVPLLAAPSIPAILPLLFLAGAFIAPTVAAGNMLMGRLAPPGMATEAYAWGPTALVVGFAGGSAVAGALAEASGWRAALAGGLAGIGVAAAYVLVRRGRLEPDPGGHPSTVH